jgi:acyl transferase domain-containing protein/acyl carrier protein
MSRTTPEGARDEMELDGDPLTEDAAGDEVAVVAMAGRFPGAADLDELWRNLRAGVESISTWSAAELLTAGVPPQLVAHPRYVKARGVLPGIELFDAPLFGLSPREAAITDPQHRVLLECAWEALEAAGIDPDAGAGRIGVYAGSIVSTYLLFHLLPQMAAADETAWQVMLANDKDALATRISYKLNLRGPSVTVQTACSTSLVAVHLARQALLDYECDAALAGGVSLRTPQTAGYLYQEAGIHSPDGHCRAFDAAARGTVFSSGAGIVVLKRLADALAAGDTVRAVLRGSAINNDGDAKVGFTAPSVDGQAEVVARALALADIDPASVQYVEAHGTGTALGDPIEVAALSRAFQGAAGRRGTCALGSVKTNLGHLDAAAGIAGLIKTVLALERREIPPSLHYTRPNPAIDFAAGPFYVNDRLRPWPAGAAGTPRRAGVSSFGIGGTNAHVIVEEAPAPAPGSPGRPWQLLPLQAKTETALAQLASRLAEHLAQHPEQDLADVAFTLQTGRRSLPWRRALVCASRAAARAALTALAAKPPMGATAEPATGAPAGQRVEGTAAVVFLFPGQGSQRLGMGAEIYQGEPVFRRELDRCSEILLPHLGFDLRQALFPLAPARQEAARRLDDTALTQPALVAVEVALARLWISWGVRPQAMLGHSVGEWAAAHLAGVLSLEDTLSLVAARGRLIGQLPGGAMLAVPLAEPETAALLGPDLSLAAVNGPRQCVVAGPEEAVERLRQELLQRQVEGRRLATSHAFHSRQLEAVVEPFARLAARVAWHPPAIPFLSNVTGHWVTAAEATDPAYWAQHLRRTVRFGDGLAALLAEPGRVLIEVGPGHALTRLARRHAAASGEQTIVAVATLRGGGAGRSGDRKSAERDSGDTGRGTGQDGGDGAGGDTGRNATRDGGSPGLAAGRYMGEREGSDPDRDSGWEGGERGGDEPRGDAGEKGVERDGGGPSADLGDRERSESAALLEAVGRLWQAGVTVDWGALHEGERRRRVPLPAYPFERQRHWVEPAPLTTASSEAHPGVAALAPGGAAGEQPASGDPAAGWFHLPSWRRALAALDRSMAAGVGDDHGHQASAAGAAEAHGPAGGDADRSGAGEHSDVRDRSGASNRSGDDEPGDRSGASDHSGGDEPDNRRGAPGERSGDGNRGADSGSEPGDRAGNNGGRSRYGACGDAWLLLGEGGGLGAALAARLAALGAEVAWERGGGVAAHLPRPAATGRRRCFVVHLRSLTPPGTAWPDLAAARRFGLDDLEDLGRQLAALGAGAARGEEGGAGRDGGDGKGSEEGGGGEEITVLAVSNGMQQVSGEEDICPAKATLLGWLRAAPGGQGPRRRVLDLVLPGAADTAALARLAARLVAEARDAAGAPLVAWRGLDRWLPVLEPAQLPAPPRPAAWLRPGGRYLVTGGLEGAAAALARRLAGAPAVHLALLTPPGTGGAAAAAGGMSGLDSPPPANTSATGPRANGQATGMPAGGSAAEAGAGGLPPAVPAAEAADAGRAPGLVAELAALGAAVLVAEAAPADADAVRAALDQVEAAWGPLHGVFHLPGPGGPAAAMASALALDAALGGERPLDFLVLFSWFEPPPALRGQPDAWAAGALLDALARRRAARGRAPALAVDWAWGAGFDRAESFTALDRALAQPGLTQVVVTLPAAAPAAGSGGAPADPATAAARADRDAAAGPDAGNEEDPLTRRIAAAWRDVLGVARLGPADNFFDLGGDSLIAVQLMTRLRDSFPVELPVQLLFDRPTLGGLRDGIEEALIARIEELPEAEALRLAESLAG